MTARVHHLNCATMCPFGRRLLNGDGGTFDRARLVARVLLVEMDGALALVDTGFGTEDVAHPNRRLGAGFVITSSPALKLEETALHQVRALGHDEKDVRHIALTHMDLDHAGGLSDFPDAEVHLTAREHDAATKRETMKERARYRSAQVSHGPKWKTHEPGGDKWFGFDSVRAIDDDVVLVPLMGHTRGHTAVAVKTAEKWVLHCGDAYFFHGEVTGKASTPPILEAYESILAYDNDARKNNQRRLRELYAAHRDDVLIVSAHCPVEFEATARA